MPELPEVETVCQGLKAEIIGAQFLAVKLSGKKLRLHLPVNFSHNITNAKVTRISRKAKYILIYLDNQYVMVVHLGMTGRITVLPLAAENKIHDHVSITLDDGRKLVFNDARRFGLVTLIHQEELEKASLFQALGPEPLEDHCDVEYFHGVLHKKSAPIKSIIMDNRVMVGVGNIYACESLFRAKISPTKPGNQISRFDASLLLDEIKNVLNDAIAAGGSSFRDYVNSSGEQGFFQQKLYVYGKHGKECLLCQTIICRITQAGRSSFFCPKCQK